MSATNNITIDTEGGETIDGLATFVIADDYKCLSLYSDGSNWFVDKSYKKAGIGGVYLYEGSQTITINTVSVYHAVIGLLESSVGGAVTYKVSLVGSITDTANNGGVLRCTDATHGLDDGDYVTLNGMGDALHNGVTRVSVIDGNTFDCDDITYNSINDTGSWQRGTSMKIKDGFGGVYDGAFTVTARSAVASKNFKFEVYANTTAFDEFAWERLFGNTGYGVGASGGIGLLKTGDVLWMAVENTTDTQDCIIRHANLHITK